MPRLLPILFLPLLLAAASQPAPVATLRGTITTAARITRLAAVDRASADVLKTSAPEPKDEFLYEGQVQPDGTFAVAGLLPGRTYDLIVWTAAPVGTAGGGTRWEGVNMDYHRSVVPSTPATAEDRKSIETLVTDVPQFYDKIRPLKIAADHQHATVLVELLRTRDFHSDQGGEVIYRVELWYFENRFGGWAKDANTEKVIARVRGKPSDLQQNWQFLPHLSNLTAVSLTAASPAAQITEPIALPEKPEAKNGLVGGIK